MSPKMYLATQGAYRGIQGAFIGSIVLILYLRILNFWFVPLSARLLLFITVGCYYSGLILLTVIPGAIGGLLLAMWLYKDAKRDPFLPRRSLWKGALVGSIFSIEALANTYFFLILVPISNNSTMPLKDAVIPFLRNAMLIFPAGLTGGLFAGWKLTLDIKNRYLHEHI